MKIESLEGGFSNIPVEAAQAFRAALDALSRPGLVTQAGDARPPAPLSRAAGTLALVLCGPETPIWLAPSLKTEEIVGWFKFHTGAGLAPRAEAEFAFGSWEELSPITDFQIGVSEYPDRSATLIVEVDAHGTAHRLTGPGIETVAHLTLPDPEAFRMNRALFPLGLDFFLTAGDRIAGVPRTTIVEA